MTSNITESGNVMFDVDREFLIVTLFDEINRIFADILKYVNLGNKLLAYQITNHKFSIIDHGDVSMVDLQKRTCTCRIFYLNKIPCPHVVAALRAQYGTQFRNQIYEYSSPYYLMKNT
ncbi:hypothetical protein H5410_045540 [Solanum commersonii]|uniref:SWIM-type domain-containing protein n=1 Tax=Solanum commersonii TaxID=4109 RepID=A0A9J5XBF2_SOLCO|nr:hypothetical protein H5410_045540 [Solanum commersonii]